MRDLFLIPEMELVRADRHEEICCSTLFTGNGGRHVKPCARLNRILPQNVEAPTPLLRWAPNDGAWWSAID